MIKRWYNWCAATHHHEMGEHSEGPFVRHSDYLALQAALREALDGWEEWLGSKADADRVEFLRKEFLDD